MSSTIWPADSAFPQICGARQWDEDHPGGKPCDDRECICHESAPRGWGLCEWHGDLCDCPEVAAAPRGLSPRPAGGVMRALDKSGLPHTPKAVAAPAPEPLTATAARTFGSPLPSSKTVWSEWKMVYNMEQPKPILNQALHPTTPIWWYSMVEAWRTAIVGGNLVVEVRFFSHNIIRQMVPLIKVAGIVGKRHYLGSKYEVIVNAFSPTMPLKYRFNDSDDALEFQAALMAVIYG